MNFGEWASLYYNVGRLEKSRGQKGQMPDIEARFG
jgi:hypothetical protein